MLHCCCGLLLFQLRSYPNPSKNQKTSSIVSTLFSGKSIIVSFGNHVLEEPVQILKNPVQEFYETRSNILKTEGQAFPVKEGSDTDEDLYG